MKACPSCQRDFTKLTDYPQVFVKNIDLPASGIIPSEGCWSKPSPEDLAEALETLKENSSYQAYRNKLLKLESSSRKILAQELELPFPTNSYFKWAHQIEDYFLAFQESELGQSKLQLYTQGPNFGSAGGPTLQEIGTLLTIHYQGIIN